MNIHRPVMLLLCWCLLGVTGEAHARNSCTPAKATDTTIDAIEADYPAWENRCVRLHGLAVMKRLYTDRQALLEGLDGNSNGAHSLVVLFQKKSRLPLKPAQVEIVGRIYSCASLHAVFASYMQDHPGEVIMANGYCHTSQANYIEPTAIRILSREAISRLVEAEVPTGKRSLIDDQPDPAVRARIIATARAFLKAIVEKNEGAFLRLSVSDLATTPHWQIDDLRHDFRRLSRPGSPFVERSIEGYSQERLFATRNGLFDEFRGFPSTIVCWCKTANCAGRWPVLRLDADNLRSRPYLCVGVEDNDEASDAPDFRARAVLETHGFAEPAWPGN